MNRSDFAHLHLHTEASNLDGMIRPSELPKRVHELGQLGCAVTDHGVMSSIFRVDEAFRTFNKENGTNLKFSPGIEAYFVPDRFERTERANWHLTLLAKSNIGLTNLMRLNSIAWMTGYYYKPRMDWALLEEHHEGLICLSGCIGGYISNKLFMNETEKAWEAARRFVDIFGSDFYIEYHDHGLPDQQKIIPELLQIAKNLNLKVVAANDCHYSSYADFEAHEILLSTQTGTPIIIDNGEGGTKVNPNRFTYEVPEFYIKDAEEMSKRIPTEYLITTREVLEKVEVDIEYGRKLEPSYPVPDPNTDRSEWADWYRRNGSGDPSKLSDDYLAYQSLKGFRELGLDKKGVEYRDRYKRELEVIWKYGFSDLLLVVWDYMRWSHDQGIRTGPRGSAAGSLVVYCLGISDPACDPIRYGLLFERFINEDRVQPPDIDVDFESGGRDRVMAYLSDKYGKDRVASIGTRSVLHILGCIRDTARALGFGYDIQNRISKELAGYAGEEDEVMLSVRLDEVLGRSPFLEQLSRQEPKLFEHASRIQGLQRQSSKHAAGAVISRYPLVDTVPLMVRDGQVITQVDMFDVEHLGLLKVDLLGLKSLSVIGKCIELIKENHPDAKVELRDIPKDDPEVYRFIREVSGLGLFQIGTFQMQEYCRRLPISCIDDLAQLIAAYRPSTARAGVTEDYVRVKEGKAEVDCYHPLLDDVLRPTGGKMIYQEQIIEVFMLVAGYTRSQADNVRRIMGKMLGEEALSVHKEAFFEGGRKRGMPDELVERLWHDLKYFSIYGFNKSHSVAYALICYQTAYFKTYYPREFLCACLCFEDDQTKFRAFLYEAKQFGVQIKGPDVNYSKVMFSIDPEGAIRFGLKRVKNCGEKSVVEIVSKQPYESFDDFKKKVNRSVVNVRVIQFLIMSGAMDCFMDGFFDGTDSAEWRNVLLKEIGKHDGIEHGTEYYEKESLGENLLTHPIDKYVTKLEKIGFRTISSVLSLSDKEVSVAGIIARIRKTNTKSGQEMAFVLLGDATATLTAIFWPDSWLKYRDSVHEGRCLAIRGALDRDQEQVIVRLAKEVV